MYYLEILWNSLFGWLPSVLSAILLLLIALLLAYIAKRIIKKLLNKIDIDKYAEKIGLTEEGVGGAGSFIANLVWLIVFLLFLPGVLDRLGMSNVAQPITSLVSRFLAYIPNIIAAIVILAVGLFIAKLVRQLLTAVLKKVKVDKLQEKAGISSEEPTTISSVIANIVYVIILIPVVIAALEALNITAISNPAIGMLNQIISYIPSIFAAIAILAIGIFIARVVGKLLTEVLSSIGTDTLLEKAFPEGSDSLKKFSLSKLTGGLVKVIIIILFIVEAVNVLRLDVLQAVGATIISYLPALISAVIIMVVFLFLATWLEKLILRKSPKSKLLATSVKVLLIIFAVFMTLNQLGLATSIVNAAFIIILSAVAVAFALSFGIGGRDFAKNSLKRLEDKSYDQEDDVEDNSEEN